MAETRSSQGYAVIKSRRIGTVEVLLAHNPKAVQPYVTWKAYAHSKFQDFAYGNYFSDQKQAEQDFQRRVEEVREDMGLPRRRKPRHKDMER